MAVDPKLSHPFLQDVAQFVFERCVFDDHMDNNAGLYARRKNVFVFFASAHSVACMATTQDEVLDIFKRTKALLQGHFVLRSGLHSGHYFQCAQVCQDMGAVTRLAELLIGKLGHLSLAFDEVTERPQLSLRVLVKLADKGISGGLLTSGS